MKKHKLKKIIGFYPDEMDISKYSGCMNYLGEVFDEGDVILLNGKKYKIIGFAAYDYDWFGAIVIGKDSSVAKWFGLGDAENLTKMKNYKGTTSQALIENGFKKTGYNTFIMNKMTIELYEKGFDAYVDSNNNEDMFNIAEGVSPLYLSSFIGKLLQLNLPSMYYEYIPSELMDELSSWYC